MNELIPVHINCCRDDTYFYYWNTTRKEWTRYKKIPEKLKKMYQLPPIRSNYK